VAVSDAEIEQTIRALLDARTPGKTICPSEAARALAQDWRPLMDPVRRVARDMPGVEITQQEMNLLINQAAQQYRPDERQKFVDYIRNEPMAAAQLRAPLFEDKVVDHLFAKAEIGERNVTRADLEAAIESEEGHVHGPGCGHDHGAKPKKAAAKKPAAKKAEAPAKAEAKPAPAKKAAAPKAAAEDKPAKKPAAKKAPEKKA